jgi:hypothetical protein
MPINQFFSTIEFFNKKKAIIPAFIKNKHALRSTLHQLGVYTPSKYLHDHYCHWLSAYACQAQPTILKNYFIDKAGLNSVCQDFIKFCFNENITLDKEKTLQAFEPHDAVSDSAVKKELAKLECKNEINLLGFGLGNGYYEKSIAEHLLNQGLAKSVKIYGFDPFGEKTEGVEFLTKEQLIANKMPIFDIVIARWVLHHVALQDRWPDFINCINNAKPGTLVLIVEHGFLQDHFSNEDRKLYYLLNATFDIVANIGIRPHWFTSTAPDIGANFFIHYLQPQDFAAIKNGAAIQLTQNIYDIGPNFPNQTICAMKIKP